jgi:Lrp/AsnC family transcriptional regulator, regulator for asnA, asnC and gidA
MARFSDDLDRSIVRLLEEDGRLPNLEIARRLGVSESTVRKRIARLMRQDGMRISASVDGGARTTDMLFFINAEAGCRLTVAERLAAIPEIQYVAVTTGGYDVVARAAFRSDADALDFLVRRLESAEGVRSVQTGHVLKNLKMPAAALPVPAAPAMEPARVAALDAFVREAARASDLATVLNLACGTAVAGLGADRVAVFTGGDDRARPVHQASRGLSMEYVREIAARITPEIGVGIRVINRHVHIYLEDATTSPLMAGVKDLVDREGYRSLLMLPLLYGSELIGLVSLYNDTVRRYTDEEIALAQAFADQMAIAVARTPGGWASTEPGGPVAQAPETATSPLTRLLVERLIAGGS